MSIVSRALCVLPLVAALLSTPARASDFITFTNPGSTPILEWSADTRTLSTDGPIELSARLNLLTFGTPERFVGFDSYVPMTFTFNAAQVVGPFPGLDAIYADGSFSLLYSGVTPLTIDGVDYGAGANILSGVFTNASIDVRGVDGVFQADRYRSYRDLTFTSDFLDFAGLPTTSLNIPFTLTVPSSTPRDPDDFTATIGSIRGSEAILMTAVPEPQTWALMITGFVLAGAALRHRQRVVA